MKPLELHLAFALAGAAALGLALVAAGAVQVQPDRRVHVGSVEPLGSSTLSLRIVNPIEVVGIPDPRDSVVIREEEGPYTVPQGKLLVFTAFGAMPSQNAFLSIDGVVEVQWLRGNGTDTTNTIASLSPGLTAPGGSVVVASDAGANNTARAWGYLIDE